jgi:hypothetical protein
MPAFLWLRRYAAATPRPIFLDDMLQRWFGFFFLVGSAQQLERAGNKAEARWMLDFGRVEMPLWFKMRNYSVIEPDTLRVLQIRRPGKPPAIHSERDRRRRQFFRGMSED